MGRKVNVAMIGVGNISGIYLENISKVFTELNLIGVCDLIRERAENAQKKYSVPKLYETMHDAFADPEVELVLNLTRPYEHFEVSKAALLAGKHVYSEKPLGATLEEGRELVRIAEEKNLYLGGAPDTFLGAGIQTCRRIIDSGEIGDVVGATAVMICRGHESWHPDPAFYYQFGGGPMLDMGPYYTTALINLLGGVDGVMGMTKASFPTRLITSQPHNGEVVKVEVPTYVTGMLRFDSGAIGTIFTTFDVWYQTDRWIEVFGSKATLQVPDPNGFGGPIRILRPGKGYEDVPLAEDLAYSGNSRALGLADMAKAIADGREARCDYRQTFHVLDIMTGFQRSSETGAYVKMETKYNRKPPMAAPKTVGILD